MEFVDAEGRRVDLAQHIGKQKLVLVVLRGTPMRDSPGSPKGKVCPSCVAQAGSLMANRERFQQHGAVVLVVFPGPADRLGELLQSARKNTPGEPEWNFRVLLDRDCEACDRLGIRDDLAKPATYIFDTRGRVVYAYVGVTSTDRPSVRAMLEQLEKTE
jgi:peroxiredoxin Q/BCP